jgi:hypothetical protein
LVCKTTTNISHIIVQKLYTELGGLSRTLNLVCKTTTNISHIIVQKL